MNDYEKWQQIQSNAGDEIRRLARDMAKVGRPIWQWGDGHGGYIYKIIIEEFENAGLISQVTLDDLQAKTSPKNRAARVRQEIFERDGYRCQECGDWHFLQVDHIYPKSKGGSNDPGNLQTLCASCNSKKGASIPDYY